MIYKRISNDFTRFICNPENIEYNVSTFVMVAVFTLQETRVKTTTYKTRAQPQTISFLLTGAFYVPIKEVLSYSTINYP